MDVTIRPRRDDDLPELAAVLVRVHATDGYPVEGVDHPEAWLHHPREVRSWTAEVDGQPIGQITLTAPSLDEDAARVWQQHTGEPLSHLVIPVRLFVDPDHRNTGAGRLLTAAAVDHAHELGCKIAFDVMAKDHDAIRLYERLGAQRLATIAHHHSGGLTEPAIVYTERLSN